MKILILGGTGAIGSHLSQILVDNGHQVYVTSREERQDRQHSISYIKGNAHDLTFLQSLLQRKTWDAIVDFMIYSTKEFEQRANILLDATSQYIYISSSRVYADTHHPITEDCPRLLDICTDKEYLETDEYALAKARQENILVDSRRKNWTVVRPYITFSEYRLQLSPAEKEYWLYGALKGRTILFSRDLSYRYTTLTYGLDVACGISALIGETSALGEAFHITSNERYRWSTILKTYVDVIEQKTGNRPRVRLLNSWSPLMGGEEYQVKMDRLYDRYFDNSKIGRFIDVNSFHKTLPTLERCMFTFLDISKFKTVNWELMAAKDRFLREWSDLTDIPDAKRKIRYILIRLGLISR